MIISQLWSQYFKVDLLCELCPPVCFPSVIHAIWLLDTMSQTEPVNVCWLSSLHSVNYPKKTEQLVILFSLRGVTHCESNLLCLWTPALCVLLSWDYFNTTFTWIGQNCSSTVFVLRTKFVKFKVKLTCNFKNIERLYMSWSQESLMAPLVHFKCFCCCCF